MAKLTLDDIADLRAYERERDQFRATVIELKKRRRVQVGPVVTVLFENRDTIRFQVQEMARAEKMISDSQIQAELDAYNPLIPDPGELSATLFIELTSDEELRRWLPRLVGIERSLELRIGGEKGREVVVGQPEEAHEATLTRQDTTASVHYVRFGLTPAQLERFAAEAVELAVNHPQYSEATALAEETRQSLLEDLRGAGS